MHIGLYEYRLLWTCFLWKKNMEDLSLFSSKFLNSRCCLILSVISKIKAKNDRLLILINTITFCRLVTDWSFEIWTQQWVVVKCNVMWLADLKNPTNNLFNCSINYLEIEWIHDNIRTIIWLKYVIFALRPRKLISVGQQFHRNQKNKQIPLTLNHWTLPCLFET
jgi:hypothetical protein